MSTKLLPPLKDEDLHIGCLTCSTAALEAPLDMPICVGFGHAYVTKDGEQVYDGEADYTAYDKAKTVAEIEEMAAKEPEHDWRIVKYGPLHGETFQRHSPGRWVCIESNQGFA